MTRTADLRRLALLMSFSVGFLSLSQEIVWVRLVSFSQLGRPQAFSFVLLPFLVGIALGAIAGRRLCDTQPRLERTAGWVLLGAAAADIVALWLTPVVLVYSPTAPYRSLLLLGLIATTAGLKGVLFPIVHHLGSDASADRVGRSVSRVYLGNVLGSTLGPIVTGFVLLDVLSVESTGALIAVGTATLGTVVLLAVSRRSGRAAAGAALVAAVCAAVLSEPPRTVVAVAAGAGPADRVKHVIQNKHGIIHVLAEEAPGLGDQTLGGNMFDGRIAVDMAVNANYLDRAYLMAVLHPAPRRVLVIGLSSGAWTRVISGLPGIEQVDVVEINPGYLELIRRYDVVAPLLDDPRVHIHIDDGRRWLRAHPQERYDLIFQNTTYHWRAYASQLLSADYLREARSHLAPGGILAVNTTGSLDAYRTAMAVFPHVLRYRSFAYMSEQPLVRRADAEQVLRRARVGDAPAFTDALFEGHAIGAQLVHGALVTAQEHLAATGAPVAPEVITDLNLVTEYRHGWRPGAGWLQPLLPRTNPLP